MSTPPAPVPAVQKILRASARKVLVVEGPTDSAVYTKWLEKLATPNAPSATLELVEAGNKERVLTCLKWFADNGSEPRVFGLVDRDEWDTTTTNTRCAELPQLRICRDRHAIESSFCDPAEFWPGLLQLNPVWAARQAAVQTAVHAALPDYVCHWALLSVTDRMKTRMSEQGYPGQFSTTVPIPSDADIRARFVQWSTTLDSNAAFAEFDALRRLALAADPNAQLRSHVWAKFFFERVIHPLLNAPPTTRLQDSHDWLVDLAEKGPQVPADIAAVLLPLL
jgi:hypothetical protein